MLCNFADRQTGGKNLLAEVQVLGKREKAWHYQSSWFSDEEVIWSWKQHNIIVEDHSNFGLSPQASSLSITGYYWNTSQFGCWDGIFNILCLKYIATSIWFALFLHIDILNILKNKISQFNISYGFLHIILKLIFNNLWLTISEF